MLSNAMKSASPLAAWIRVIAAVNVVFPWSTWPIVPTFTCGLFRSNLALAMFRFLVPVGSEGSVEALKSPRRDSNP
jgi:hypothetical protein